MCQEHPARAIGGVLEKVDLSAFYGSIKAVLARPGRPTTDPQVLLALWLLATVKGKEHQQQTLATAKRAKVTPARTSTTDPEAHVLKMPDGGFHPACNVGLATDTARGIIAGVAVSAEGTDAGQALPMVEQVTGRTGQQPKAYLIDGGFATRDDITALGKRGITVYAPVRLPRNQPEEERYTARYGDTQEVVRWRQRMATDEAKGVYKKRGATAEWANAQARPHGVPQFTVRSLAPVLSVALLVAIAHDILRWVAVLG